MLHQLLAYAQRNNLTSELGFAPKNVQWLITCNRDGKFTGVIPLGEGRQGQRFDMAPDLMHPEMIRGGVTRSHFLVDTLDVVTLFQPSDEDEALPEKVQLKHTCFIKLLQQAADEIRYPDLAVTAKLLSDESALQTIRRQLREAGPPKARPNDKCTVRVGSGYPLESNAWHDWWRAFRQKEFGSSQEDEPAMRCLLTGEMVEPAKTHPKIKGLARVGGRGMGDALISFDKKAFESYGLEQSANATTSEQTAKNYSDVLNLLLRDHSHQLAGAIMTHWYKEPVPTEKDIIALLTESPEQEERNAQKLAAELLEAIEEGKYPDLHDNHYYALTLSGNAGRVVVRDWMEGPFEDLVRSVNQWFGHLEIVNVTCAGIAKPPKLESVITGLLPPRKPSQKYKDWIKPVGAHRLTLWHAALKQRTIPDSIAAQALLQHRSFVLNGDFDVAFDPQGENRALRLSLLYVRMGLLKTYLLRKGDKNMKPKVNPEHPDPAYHAGRLMAVLARLQRRALGEVRAGVVQRYYTGASQNPSRAIGPLVANAQNHLSKLKGGLPHWFEDQIAEIMVPIGDQPPGILDWEQQSLFALGYYQQLAELNRKKDEHKEGNNE